MLSELNEVPGIEIMVQEIGAATATDEFKDIEDAFDLKLTKEIHEFYSQIGFVRIEWKFSKPLMWKGNEYPVDGKINILPLHEVFWGKGDLGWGNVLWFEHMEAKVMQSMKSLRPFDFFDPEDNGCISFHLKKEVVASELVLYSTDNGFHPLKLNIGSYLQLLLQTKGIYRWQFLLVKARANENEIFKATMKGFLPLLFKNKDYDLFMKNINH